MIESFDCTKCGACLTACAQNAIVRVSGRARIPEKPARLKGVAVEAAVEEEGPARREGAGKRKRSFARPAGASAPAAPKEEAASAPAPVETPVPAAAETAVTDVSNLAPASERVIRSENSGKRKRNYAKPVKSE